MSEPESPHVVIVHGWTGSGPGHWQSLAAVELANEGFSVDVPQFTDPDKPVLDVWLDELREHLEAAPSDVERIVLAHSAGALLWLHHASHAVPAGLRVNRVLLVAPPGPDWHEPEVTGFQPTPLDPAGLRRAAGLTRMVISDDDPCGTVTQGRQLAGTLGVDLDVI